MPKSRRPKPLYARGPYRLDANSAGTGFTITWYDAERKRERERSARTKELESAKLAVDQLYQETFLNVRVCPTCRQEIKGPHSAPITDLIEAYMTTHAQYASSAQAIRARLNHVLDFVQTLPAVPMADEIDESWVAAFRRWMMAQPIITPTKKHKPRAVGTVEASVRQLAAAISFGKGRQIQHGVKFTPKKPWKVSSSPTLRAGVPELIKMFRYATALNTVTKEPMRSRQNLLRYLRAAVCTIARPDAIYDISTAPERRQWHSKQRVLALNPAGREQTSKYRATVPIVEHLARELDVTNGPYLTVDNIRSPFKSMLAEIGLQVGDGTGSKLIRRSMADIVRARLSAADIPELEMFMGHRTISATTEIYAPFNTSYLKNAKAAIASVCDEIEAAVPGAFYREITAKHAKGRQEKAA